MIIVKTTKRMLICIRNWLNWAKGLFTYSNSYLFQNYTKTDVPYITLNVQGQPLNMLIDTGCGISIMSSSVLDKLHWEESPRQIALAALTSDSLNSNVVSISMNIGNKKITEDFAVYQYDDMANFQKHYGITLHGILGGEFFEKTGCKIDYKKHCLIIP